MPDLRLPVPLHAGAADHGASQEQAGFPLQCLQVVPVVAEWCFLGFLIRLRGKGNDAGGLILCRKAFL